LIEKEKEGGEEKQVNQRCGEKSQYLFSELRGKEEKRQSSKRGNFLNREILPMGKSPLPHLLRRI